MISRLVTLSFKPENVATFLNVFDTYKNDIKSMPGCLHLELLRDVEDMNTFSTYSVWISEKNLNDYRKSELFGKVWPQTKKLFNSKPSTKTFHLISSSNL